MILRFCLVLGFAAVLSCSAEDDGGGLVLRGLPYAFEALEPAIDMETMKLHWGRHHKAYTDNANTALRGLVQSDGVSADLKRAAQQALKNDEDSLKDAVQLAIKEEQKQPAPATRKLLRSLRNNGGGFANHNDYWSNLAPNSMGGGGEPEGPLAKAIEKTFGSIERFRDRFNEDGMSIFGSGWVWLVLNHKAELEIVTTPNQDRPADGYQVILGCDVWEHAYYLKHHNRRHDYLVAFWSVVNYKIAEQRYEKALAECKAAAA